jgi:surfeit locus 1 family protein
MTAYLHRTALWAGAGLIVACLVALGTWQVQRLHWKNALVAAVNERTRLPPAPLGTVLAQSGQEYRPVTALGHYRPDKEIRLYTVLGEPKGKERGPGWFIITPLEQPDGAFILVNRGFVPVEDMNHPDKWRAPEGEVTVTGLLRLPEPRNLFSADDRPDKGEFYTRDPLAMAKAMGIDAPTVVIDKNAEGDTLPQGGETRLEFPNRHLEYALTWYGLAATFTVLCAVMAFQSRKKRDNSAKRS